MDNCICRMSAVPWLKKSSWAALAVVIGGFSSFEAAAADPNYFQGKTFTLVVQSKPGGGTDTTARLVGRFWNAHIPGKPDVLIRNKPNGVIAGNDLHHKTRPDGLTVGVFAGGGSLGPVARKSKSVRYNPLEWGYIGQIDRGPSIMFIRKSALKRLNDPNGKPINFGSISTDRPQDAMAVFAGEYAGWNVKFVLGYPSSNDVYLAYERGEVDMFASGTKKILDRFRKEGQTAFLFGDAKRRDYPDVPSFEEYLGAKKPTGLNYQAYRAWAGTSAVDKYFVTPPKTPPDILQILRASFMATVDDPSFQNEARKILGDGYVAQSGEETQAKVRDALEIPENVVSIMRKLREKYGLPIVSTLK